MQIDPRHKAPGPIVSGPIPSAASAERRVAPQRIAAPAAKRRPKVLSAHGRERVDPWYWLRDRDDPEVKAYLEAENAYAEARLAGAGPLRQRIYSEILSRIEETDMTVPVKKGPWMYFARSRRGFSYPIHCRARSSMITMEQLADASQGAYEGEEVILDENELSACHDYFALGGVEPSPNHRLLAYLVDTTGGELFTLRLRDLDAGTDLDDEVPHTSYGLAWSNDARTIFYTRPDEAMRPWQLWRHELGSSPETDVCVYTETDDRFHLGVTMTKDDAFILVSAESKSTSEILALRADNPSGPLQPIQPRRHGIEYSVDHCDHRFIVLTNEDAEEFRLIEIDDALPRERDCTEIVAHRPGTRITGFDVFDKHLAVYERSNATSSIRVIDLDASTSKVLEVPEAPSTVWEAPNPEISSRVLRYNYTSLVTPHSVLEHNMETGATTLLKQQVVPSGYDPSLYRTDRLWATAGDGTRVPISIVYRKEVAERLPAPTLLYGYGSYEYCIDPRFSPARLTLLDRGFIYAIAHVRGGGEMGRSWYLDGKLEHKKNTFSDFIACGRHLIEQGWTAPDRLVARGGSAGGLLMGAVANMEPELFHAIVAEVPFVDCLTTMLDPTLPLTAIEWEEWGNPVEDPRAYDWIGAYSPYDNVTSLAVPHLLVLAGLNDPRVAYWEPVKWVAKIRATQPGSDVVLRVAMSSGHAGPSGRYAAIEEEALVLAFILESVGIND